MLVNVTKNNINIENSYRINIREEMQKVLTYTREMYSIEECDVLKRTDKSLINEWCAHNLFYNLHLFRSHTKDVDLNYPQSKITEIVYSIVSFFYKIIG